MDIHVYMKVMLYSRIKVVKILKCQKVMYTKKKTF